MASADPRETFLVTTAHARVEDFVEEFRRYVDQRTIFVPTEKPQAVGSRFRFAIQLKDRAPVLAGEGRVARTFAGPGGRNGMRLEILDLDEPSRAVLGKILELGPLVPEPDPPPPRPVEENEGDITNVDVTPAASASDDDASDAVARAPVPENFALTEQVGRRRKKLRARWRNLMIMGVLGIVGAVVARQYAPTTPVPAKLELASFPPGAEFSVDGMPVGVSPAFHESTSDEVVRVKATLPGYAPWEQEVRVKPGLNAVQARMEPLGAP